MTLRPLGIAKEIIEATGLSMEYTYDDLILIEHNPFIVQFDDTFADSLNIYFNINLEIQEREHLETLLLSAAVERQFTLNICGTYDITQLEGQEEIQIEFCPN